MSFLFACLPTANSRKQHRYTQHLYATLPTHRDKYTYLFVWWYGCMYVCVEGLATVICSSHFRSCHSCNTPSLLACWHLSLASGQHCNLQHTNCRYIWFRRATLASRLLFALFSLCRSLRLVSIVLQADRFERRLGLSDFMQSGVHNSTFAWHVVHICIYLALKNWIQVNFV